MKVNGNTIKPGNVIEHQNRLWVATKTMAVKPGKGGAFNQVELKDIQSGTKLNERFRADEQIERVRLDESPYQYLFMDGDDVTLMHTESYEQINVSGDLIGEPIDFLQDGMIVTVTSYEEKIISVTLPDTIVMEVVEADPVVKGQTAASSYKPGKLENGRRVLVPPFLESGEKIVVNTADGTYVERAKS